MVEEWEKDFQTETAVLRRISRYSGIGFDRLLEIPYSFYLLLNRDSWIDSWQKSEEGRELLKTVWRLGQTGADLTAVRNFERREQTWQE